MTFQKKALLPSSVKEPLDGAFSFIKRAGHKAFMGMNRVLV